MPPSQPDPEFHNPDKRRDFLAALLSYLIPGLGQVVQGRIGKGVLFFVSLYTLFFYGMMMGKWKNVWLPETDTLPKVTIRNKELEGPLKTLSYRPQFAGQFFIGVAAWPAIYQHATYDGTKPEGGALGTYQRVPNEEILNNLQRDGDKRWDLGWVFTVIAGALNLLVIYDAFAGPVLVVEDPKKNKGDGKGTTPTTATSPPPPPPLPPATAEKT